MTRIGTNPPPPEGARPPAPPGPPAVDRFDNVPNAQTGPGMRVQMASDTTLRLDLAGRALQGFCANPAVFAESAGNGWSLVNCTDSQLASTCLALADALIEENARAL